MAKKKEPSFRAVTVGLSSNGVPQVCGWANGCGCIKADLDGCRPVDAATLRALTSVFEVHVENDSDWMFQFAPWYSRRGARIAVVLHVPPTNDTCGTLHLRTTDGTIVTATIPKLVGGEEHD